MILRINLVSLCASYSTPKKKITYWDCLCYCFTSEGLKINCTKPTIKETVELIIRDYYQNLKEKHEIDYELILYYSYCLLKENKSICKTLSNIFPYILIDEYDHFTNQLLTTYNDPLYEEVTTNASFLCTFFKVIKAGIGEGSIRTCFCTGVLPVTMDDLTNGYNITEILTLEPDFLNMLGFTYKEIEGYLRYILDKYAVGQGHFDETWQLIVSNYAGYRFHPNGESLFNATVFTYFFKNFVVDSSTVLDVLIEENIQTDINWIRQLTLSLSNVKATLDTLAINGELFYGLTDLYKKIDKQSIFTIRFYPIILFYWGVVTLKNKYSATFPNEIIRNELLQSLKIQI